MSPRDESSSLALPHNHPARRLPRRRNINRLPFRRSGRPLKSPACKNGTTLSLRTGSPASKCCSRGTLLHFSLQSSHLNICYCHQDLHQGRLHATSQSAASPQYNQAGPVHAVIPRASRPTDVPAPSYSPAHRICALLYFRRLSMGGSLERHPFSGLVHSAGELLHTPWRIPTSMATVLLSR